MSETTPSTVSNFPESAQNNASSSAYPGPSIFNPSDSTIAVAGEATQAPASKAALQGKHLETPIAPQRSSSRSKLSSEYPTSMPDQASANPISVSKRGSKESLKPKSRSGSLASTNSKQAASPANNQRSELAESKSKGRGGFLYFLNCCNTSEDAKEYELADQAVPAKKTKVQQQKPGRQATPVVNPTINPGEGSKQEVKGGEESIGGPEYSELKPATKPKMITRSSKEKISPEKPGSAGSAVKPPDQPVAPLTHESPLPPLPQSNAPPVSQTEKTKEIPTPKVIATAEQPPQIVTPDESVAVQGITINDRTPKQEAQDSDVVMPDAPPLPVARETPSQNTPQESTQAQISLPPPPPRNGQDRSVSSNTSNITPNERQQWLLPPLQPHLKGRKCLVLDLDETLVHSSFKVCLFILGFDRF